VAIKREYLAHLRFDDEVERAAIAACRFAFDAAQFVQRGSGIASGFVLRLTQQDVAGNRAFHPRLEAAMFIQQHQRFAFIGEPVHQRGRNHDVAESDQTGQVVQWNLQTLFAFHIDAHGGIFQMRVGLGHHDVKRIQYVMHFVLRCETQSVLKDV
jgi:hypothetical protein